MEIYIFSNINGIACIFLDKLKIKLDYRKNTL